MKDEYANIWEYRLKWAYLLGVVGLLLLPVFFNLYISFNEFGYGARDYAFTLDWYAVVFTDQLLVSSLGWTMLLAVVTMAFTVPMGVMIAKLFKSKNLKLLIVTLMLTPLFVPSDIFASSMLVYFKQLNKVFVWLSEVTGFVFFETWFELGFLTAVIGLVIYTLPYVFIVVLFTMGRYHPDRAEAARNCGATAWQVFWDIEFPQIRAGIFSSCSFVLILTFNEYTRTSMLKGGFDTFTSVLISQMLNTGMSEQSYAMGGIISCVAILFIGGLIVTTMIRSERLERIERAKAQPCQSE